MFDPERRSWLPIAMACLAGVVLRTHRLPGQILTGDEWHALHRAIHLPYRELLTSFGLSDHSLGLALYFKAAIDSVGLTDLVLRAPFLAASVLALAVIPWSLRREVGGFASATLAWLMALSPILIFFGRSARPYALTLLGAWIAALAFRGWWETGARRLALVFWLCAVITGYLLVIALPFALGALVPALVQAIRRRRPAPLPGLRELLWLGFATAAALAVLLLPAVITDRWSLSGRPAGPVVRQGFSLDEALGAFQVLCGDPGPALCWTVGALACLGALRSARRAPALTRFLLTLSTLQVVAIYLALPAGIAWRVVLGRYLLPVLPVLLLLVAMGIEALAALAQRGRPLLCVGLAAVLALGLFACGPAPGALLGPAGWVSHQIYVGLWYGRDGYPGIVRRVPPFYEALGRLPPGALTLVEVPSYIFSISNPIPRYQAVHRQRTLVGFHNGLCGRLRKGEVPFGRRGIHLGNYVFLAEPEALARAGATHVVFHERLSRETTVQPLIVDEPDLSECVAAFRSRFGEPAYRDQDMVVFDVGGRGATRSP